MTSDTVVSKLVFVVGNQCSCIQLYFVYQDVCLKEYIMVAHSKYIEPIFIMYIYMI